MYLNDDEKKQFQKPYNSWGFRISFNKSGKYCFQIFPNMKTTFPIFHSKLCFLVHPDTPFINNETVISISPQFISRNSVYSAFYQNINPEFIIVHFSSNATGVFYSPDYYHSIYYLNNSILNIRLNHFDSIIINKDSSYILYYSESKQFYFNNFTSKSNFFIAYSSSTTEKEFTFLKKDHSLNKLFVHNISSKETKEINSTIENVYNITVCGGLILYSNYKKRYHVYISIFKYQDNPKEDYLIHKFYTCNNHTEQMTYPAIIPNITQKYPYPKGWKVNLSYITSDTQNVQRSIITGASSFNSNYPQWSVIYGNFLAVSNTYGRTYFTIMTFANDVIENFYISNKTSRFIFRTKNKKEIYYGDLYSNIVEQVPFDTNRLHMKQTLITFNSNDELEFIDISNPQSPIHYPVPPESIQQTYNWCPYLKITYEFFDLDYFTRVRQPVSSTTFPSQIFLDHCDTFHFRIHATYHRTVPNLLFSSPFYFNLNHSKTIDYSYSMVTYDFWIKDALTYDEYFANGYQTKSERFDLFFENSSSSCKNFHTYFDVTLGCIPGLKLEYEFQHKQEFFNGEPMEILQFSPSWSPQFYLYDTARDMKIQYNSLMTIDVVGYGLDNSSFIENSDLTINMGEKRRIFGYTSNMYATAATHENNTIQWLCQIGSVCNKVTPTFPEPPCYYFKLRARTIPRNLTNSSFCQLETEFYVKLSGIPMDVLTRLKFSFSSLFVFFLIFIIMYCNADKLPLMRYSNPIIHLHED